MSIEDLGPGPDIDAVDTATMDRGDSLEALNEVLAEPTPEDTAEVEQVAEELTGEKEETPEEAPEEDQPRNDKGQFDKKEAKIPKSRFDEAVGKERDAREAAERRAAALEKQIAEQQAQQQRGTDVEAMEAKVSEMEKYYNQLLLDGEVDKATEIMSQIRRAERQLATAEVEARTTKHTAQVLESERMEAAIARLEADHAVLNPESELFDESLVNFVLSEQRRLIQSEGLSPSKAIALAATNVVAKYGPKAESAPETKGLSKAAEERKSAAVKKNLDAQGRQPSNLKDSGMDSDKLGAAALPDVTRMSQDEFNALPESTKAKLRGDFL